MRRYFRRGCWRHDGFSFRRDDARDDADFLAPSDNAKNTWFRWLAAFTLIWAPKSRGDT